MRTVPNPGLPDEMKETDFTQRLLKKDQAEVCQAVSHTHGFALIELLVVLATVTLLLSILMPALFKVK